MAIVFCSLSCVRVSIRSVGRRGKESEVIQYDDDYVVLEGLEGTSECDNAMRSW